MASLVLQKVAKIAKPLKVITYGPSYAGKTYGSLVMAAGVVMEKRQLKDVKEAYKHILLIDTEAGRGSLYSYLGEYYYYNVEAPFTTQKLNDIINSVNSNNDIDVIIIDSLTHFWAKKGGILDQKNQKDKLGGNSYTNWQDYTQLFNDCLDYILTSPKVIFCTSRSKSDTAIEKNDAGKTEIKTYGVKPEMREGIDFEFDVSFNVDKGTHNLMVDKGIPGMDLVYDPATPELGKLLYNLSTKGATNVERTVDTIKNNINLLCKGNPAYAQFVKLQMNGQPINTLTAQQLKDIEAKLLKKIREDQAKNKAPVHM